jgi:type I restriction enzyme S subunit
MKITVNPEWESLKLEEMVSYAIGGDWGKDPKINHESYSDVYCIRGSEFRYWQQNKGKTASLRKVKKTSLEKRSLKEGDILVEISGGGPEQPVGRTVVIDKSVLSFSPDIPKICTNFIRLVRLYKEIDSEYVNYFLDFFYRSGEVVKYQAGSNNLRNLKFGDYLSINIPIPSLNEQKSVIAKIEEIYSDLDNAIDNLKKAKDQLKVYRQSVLKYAFAGKLCALESKFITSTLGEEFFIVMGQSPKSEFYNNKGEGLPFFQGKREFSNLYAVADTWTTSYTKSVKKNDVLLSIRAPIGPVNLAPDKCALGRGLAGFKTNGLTEAKFIFYLLKTLDHEMNKRGTGTTFKAITKSNLFGIEICLPVSDSDRKKIVQEIESRFSVCDKMEETIDNSLEQAEALRQSILKQAFEGNLTEDWRKKHPDLVSGENSAKALLERIKKEREALKNTKKRKK